MVLLLCVVREMKIGGCVEAKKGAMGGATAGTFLGYFGSVEIDEGPGSEALISRNQGA